MRRFFLEFGDVDGERWRFREFDVLLEFEVMFHPPRIGELDNHSFALAMVSIGVFLRFFLDCLLGFLIGCSDPFFLEVDFLRDTKEEIDRKMFLRSAILATDLVIEEKRNLGRI